MQPVAVMGIQRRFSQINSRGHDQRGQGYHQNPAFQSAAECPVTAFFQTINILSAGNEGCNGGGGSHADVSERFHQQKGEADIGGKNDNTVFYRRLGVAAGKKVWRQRLNQHIDWEPDRIGDDSTRRHGCFQCAEFAVLKQDVDYRDSQDNQGKSRWNREKRAIFYSVVLYAAGFS